MILKRGTKKPARQSQIARDDLVFDHLATININNTISIGVNSMDTGKAP